MIMDNFGTHNHPKVKALLEKHPRLRCHFTPTASLWLNLVKRWFEEITRKCIHRGTFRSVSDLLFATEVLIKINNVNPKPFVWAKTISAI